MTDHDRGAYTPQTDAPLAFDARQSRGGGGGGGSPAVLIISGVILLLLIGAVALFYRGGMRSPNEPPPVVGEPVGPFKSAAPADAQPPPPPAQPDVYNSGQAAPPAEPAFAEGPELPLPRPAPRPSLKVETDDLPPVETAGPPPAKAPPAAPALKPAPKPATPAPVPSKAAPAPAPVAGGAAVVQIGAFSSEALAAKGWGEVAMDFPSDMAGKGRRVEPVTSNGATLYRGQITGFASRDAAAAFCGKLKASGRTCIVK